MYLVRMVSLAKWDTPADLPLGSIPADAVTTDLKTTENTLSFWKSRTSSEDDIREAVLALVAGRTSIEKIEIVWLEDSSLQSDTMQLIENRGRTLIEDLVDSHTDLRPLSHQSLSQVAEAVASAIRRGRSRQFRKKEVSEMLEQAVNESRVPLQSLPEKIRAKLSR